MSYNARLASGQAAKAATGITGAIGTTAAGTWFDMSWAQPGTELNALITTYVTTASVVFTPSIQVSNDQSTIYTLATATASAAGTGSVVTTNQVWRSYGPVPWKWARVLITVSGATAAGADDKYACSWSYMRDAGGS